MASGAEAETTAQETHSTETQGDLPRSPTFSSTTMAVSTPKEAAGAPWECPQYFLSESVAALPASSYVPMMALPESGQPNGARFSLSGPAFKRFKGQELRQQLEADSRPIISLLHSYCDRLWSSSEGVP
ncbi:unnamed protein product [Mortierella alpina]